MPEKQIRRAHIQRYFEQHPGENVYLKDVEESLGLTPGENGNRVQSAIWSLINKDGINILVVQRGQAWRYVPNAKKAKRLFEELATTKLGHILVQDEDGNVYRLEEM